MSSYMGLIELIIVLAFAAGWGLVELVGMRLDKEKAATKDKSKRMKKPARKRKR
jgi:hypothetical protein